MRFRRRAHAMPGQWRLPGVLGAEKREWYAKAEEAIRAVAGRLERFTTEDVWTELDVRGVRHPEERRWMGPLLNRMARAKVPAVSLTNTWRKPPGAARRNHGRPMAVWRSLILDPKGPLPEEPAGNAEASDG